MNPADKVEQRSIESLIPYARNSRTHSDAQVAQIAASIKEWGWTTPILVDEQGGVIAGHGRLMAARKLGMAEVPVMVAKGWTEAQKRAYVIADNKLALNAGWDAEALRIELAELDAAGFDLELTGFVGDDLTKAMFGDDALDVEPDEPEEQQVNSAFEISVACDNEQEQERVYQMLTNQGLKCRVLTM
jgi:ParB-like chromosome segregation protein Spo0J